MRRSGLDSLWELKTFLCSSLFSRPTKSFFKNLIFMIRTYFFLSAGGIGVILNLDRIAKRLQTGGFKIDVRGLADSGWYLDIPSCPAGGKHCQSAKIQENVTKMAIA